MLSRLAPGTQALVVAASRSAADELAAAVAAEKGGLFGVTRAGFIELATRLALPALARDGLAPSTALGESALVTRVAFEADDEQALGYFAPVAGMPGFPLALGRTLAELRQAGVEPGDLGEADPVARGTSRSLIPASASGREDLATLLDRATHARVAAGAADYADTLAAAAQVISVDPDRVRTALLVLLDVAVTNAAEQAFLETLVRASTHVFATVPQGDRNTERVYRALGATDVVQVADPAPSALVRLQQHLFSDAPPPKGVADSSVVLFSAPGESREAVEIARRILEEGARGVPFDQMAVLLRAPQTYLGVLEHALTRAGVPAWFHRGTRRPDPAGRALLALLACADERLSARRFAEYVSLSQVPMEGDDPDEGWTPPIDDVTSALVPANERVDETQPEDEAAAGAARGASARVVAGTLRAPWRWEDLIVEAAVIGGIDRWQRRLQGLGHEYQRRLREAESEDPESPRARALRRDAEQLDALASFALPVLDEMASWPQSQRWDDWLTALLGLAPRVLRAPARVVRVLQELGPLGSVGPVSLREVRDVLTPRLSTLTHEPPRRRHGRVFVGTPHAARGRVFRAVFVPGLAERVFPQRIREDALLLDDQRSLVSAALRTRDDRAVDERLQLALSAGAASERLYLSFPRMELNESRPRVPSFYVLDIVRAIEGAIPSAVSVAARAFAAGESTLAWPAPAVPDVAIDDFEHDLATLGGLLRSLDPAAVKGRARYLYELSPELQRSLTARWLRWHRRSWDKADGLVGSIAATAAAVLAGQRLGARSYSLTALQRFASCPYQFLLAAIYRLAPLEAPAPLQRLDPLTRGDLFHRIQAAALRTLKEHNLLPLAPADIGKAHKLLEWAVTEVDKEAFDELAPAIERVWRDEIQVMTRDLKIWIEHLAAEGAEWTPEYFELAFGLADTAGRDAGSIAHAALVDGRFLLRGSIDLVERHRQTGLLRVTDHKTGKNRTSRGVTVVQGGRVLQPVIYGLAVEALWPHERVYSGRLSFCTSAGGFAEHEIPLLDGARHHGLEVLEIVDRAIERGILAARPAVEACRFCDFGVVCGRDEERRTGKKARELMADLDALRALP